MKLYLLRHGRTRWNEEGKLQGRTDVPLNEEGRAGALRAREELRNVPFSAVFSSPLSRARETAEIIAAGKAAVTTDERLLELRFGAPEPPRQEDLPTLLAKSFLQSVAGGLRASALLALSQNLLACVDFDGLRAFLGPFSGFETARFVPPGEGGLTLAVYQDEGPGRCLRRLRLLSFDFVNQQGDLRIDDLRAYV